MQGGGSRGTHEVEIGKTSEPRHAKPMQTCLDKFRGKSNNANPRHTDDIGIERILVTPTRTLFSS